MKNKFNSDVNLPLNKTLKLYLSNGCHGLKQKVISFNDVAIVYVKRNAYRIQFWYMDKDDAISINE